MLQLDFFSFNLFLFLMFIPNVYLLKYSKNCDLFFFYLQVWIYFCFVYPSIKKKMLESIKIYFIHINVLTEELSFSTSVLTISLPNSTWKISTHNNDLWTSSLFSLWLFSFSFITILIHYFYVLFQKLCIFVCFEEFCSQIYILMIQFTIYTQV